MTEELNPTEKAFLDFIDRDIAARPEKLIQLTPKLIEQLKELTKGVVVDLDAPIEGDVDL